MMSTFDHHILLEAETCARSIISTFLSYLLYHNHKLPPMIQNIHANMIFLTFTIYPEFHNHIMIVMIYSEFPFFDVIFVTIFKKKS